MSDSLLRGGSRNWLSARISAGKLSALPALRGLLVVAGSAALAAIFSGLNRPLWIDEFLHFALAGQSWPDVWNFIVLTSPGTNHGQTWFYQVLSIFLLNLFGSGFVGVRLISWAATFVLLVSTYYFLRLFSVPMGIRLSVVGLILANRYFSFEMGNGRAYILLVATAALAAYALFSLLLQENTGFKSKILFGAVVIIGGFNHPYFPVILGALLVSFFLVKALMRDEALKSTLWLVRSHLILTALSGLLSIAVGRLTWMRGSRDFSDWDPFRPFEKYGLDVGVPEFVALTALFAAGVTFFGFWIVGAAQKSALDLRLLVGSVLVVVGIVLALFFTWVSIFRSYYIYPRQWLPGAFLVFIGIALLLAVLFSYLAKRELRVVAGVGTIIVWAAAVTMIVFGSARELYIAAENRAWWENLSPLSLESAVDDGNRFWVVAGNLNIKCDTTVWPELALYYSHPPPESMLEEIQGKASACKESD